MTSLVRINLGCNDLKLKGFVNIDIDERVKPDLVADSLNLPYDNESVDEIYAGHLLEHTTMNEGALKEWNRVLKKGGKITITVPDTEKSLESFNKGEMTLDFLNQVVYGADDRDEQNHHQLFTEKILLEQMSQYFDTKIIQTSPLVAFDVNWQTIGEGIKR